MPQISHAFVLASISSICWCQTRHARGAHTLSLVPGWLCHRSVLIGYALCSCSAHQPSLTLLSVPSPEPWRLETWTARMRVILPRSSLRPRTSMLPSTSPISQPREHIGFLWTHGGQRRCRVRPRVQEAEGDARASARGGEGAARGSGRETAQLI